MEKVEIFGVPYLKEGSGIHIKDKNKGKFTASAKAHGMEVLEFAAKVLNNKEDYSPTLVKRANFARNAKKFKHEEGSKIHKPFGHRSVLDNGWLSTKLLKNKKECNSDLTMRLIPKHQNTTGPLLPNNYVVKPAWQQQEENYTPEWLKKLSPQEEARLKTIQESERKRKEHLKAKQTEYLGDWGVMSRSMRTTNPVSVLHHHLQNQGYGEQARQMAKNTGMTEAGVLMTIPTVYGLATAPIPTLTSVGTGYLGSKAGEYVGEAAETHLGAPEYTSNVLGLIGGLYGGFKGTQIGKAAEIPVKTHNLNAYGSRRFWNDVIRNPAKTVTARKQGYYPMNFSERRLMMQEVKLKVNEGIEYAADRGKMLALNSYNVRVKPKTVFTGAKTAARRYGPGAYENNSSTDLGFSAFSNDYDGTLTFPLRTNTKSLLPNLYLTTSPTLIGAHEAQHLVQRMFEQPLTRHEPLIPGGYNRWLHPELDYNVTKTAINILGKAKTTGLWEGALDEMDSELVGWLAEQKLPYKYSALSLDKRNELAKRAAVRFGLSENEYPLFNMLFKNMEDAGY